jgi:hypothetical protein
MAILRRLHIESGSQEFKMVVPTRMYIYIKFFTRKQKISKFYLHVFGVGKISGAIGYALS